MDDASFQPYLIRPSIQEQTYNIRKYLNDVELTFQNFLIF